MLLNNKLNLANQRIDRNGMWEIHEIKLTTFIKLLVYIETYLKTLTGDKVMNFNMCPIYHSRIFS